MWAYSDLPNTGNGSPRFPVRAVLCASGLSEAFGQSGHFFKVMRESSGGYGHSNVFLI